MSENPHDPRNLAGTVLRAIPGGVKKNYSVLVALECLTTIAEKSTAALQTARTALAVAETRDKGQAGYYHAAGQEADTALAYAGLKQETTP